MSKSFLILSIAFVFQLLTPVTDANAIGLDCPFIGQDYPVIYEVFDYWEDGVKRRTFIPYWSPGTYETGPIMPGTIYPFFPNPIEPWEVYGIC